MIRQTKLALPYNHYKLEWDDYIESKNLIYYWYYFFLKNILYIGQSYSDIDKEIKQQLRLKNLGEKTIIKVGRLVESTNKKISHRIVLDIEAALIFANKPILNKQLKNDYYGRLPIKITNISEHLRDLYIFEEK